MTEQDDTADEPADLDEQTARQLDVHFYKALDELTGEMDRRTDQALILSNAGGAVAVLSFLAQAGKDIAVIETAGRLAVAALTSFVIGMVLISVTLLIAGIYYKIEGRRLGIELGYEEGKKKFKSNHVLLQVSEFGQILALVAFLVGCVCGIFVLGKFLDLGEAHAAETVAIKPVDGDTFWYNGTKLRLMTVDTPEPTKYGNAECPYEAELGDRASAFTKNIITTREIEWSGKNDRYKRAGQGAGW